MEVFKTKALPLVLIFEGRNYVDHPMDNGGPTKFGITQKSYNTYRSRNKLSEKSIKNITMDEVVKIYYNNFWLPSKCDQIGGYTSIALFDTTVNSGLNRASKILQQSVGVATDGVIGSNTLKTILSYDDVELANKYLANRKKFYDNIVKQNPTQKVFYKGWIRRLNFLNDYINNKKSLNTIIKQW